MSLRPFESEAALQREVDSGNEHSCARFFEDLTESQRRALRTLARRLYTEQRQGLVVNAPGLSGRLDAARVAVLATGTWSQIKQTQLYPRDSPLTWGSAPTPESAEIKVLRDRRPPWFDKWAEWLCDRQLHRYWRVIYELELQETISRPASEAWLIGFQHQLGVNAEQLRSELERNPGLIDGPLWSLFEVQRDDRPEPLHPAWQAVISWLLEQERIDRDRVLDACLAALERDFHPQQAKWFVELHEQLKPTASETSERLERYVSLQSSRVPRTSRIALRVVRANIDSSTSVASARAAVQSLRPCLSAKTKIQATEALKTLRALVKAHPELSSDAALLALDTLLHDSADVQSAGLDLYENWKEHAAENARELQRRLAELAEVAAPALRVRVADLLSETPETEATVSQGALSQGTLSQGTLSQGTLSQGTGESAQFERLKKRAAAIREPLRTMAGLVDAMTQIERGVIEPVVQDLAHAPRLDPSRLIEPVRDHDELLELAARAIEGDVPPIELWRIADAVSRLGAQNPSDIEERSATLRQRIIGEDRSNPTIWEEPQHQVDVGALVIAWLDPECFTRGVEEPLREGLEGEVYETTVEGQFFTIGPALGTYVITSLSLELAARLPRRSSRSAAVPANARWRLDRPPCSRCPTPRAPRSSLSDPHL